jgi:hypothetical protein
MASGACAQAFAVQDFAPKASRHTRVVHKEFRNDTLDILRLVGANVRGSGELTAPQRGCVLQQSSRPLCRPVE